MKEGERRLSAACCRWTVVGLQVDRGGAVVVGRGGAVLLAVTPLLCYSRGVLSNCKV